MVTANQNPISLEHIWPSCMVKLISLTQFPYHETHTVFFFSGSKNLSSNFTISWNLFVSPIYLSIFIDDSLFDLPLRIHVHSLLLTLLFSFIFLYYYLSIQFLYDKLITFSKNNCSLCVDKEKKKENCSLCYDAWLSVLFSNTYY